MARLSAVFIIALAISTCEASPISNNVLLAGHCRNSMSAMTSWQKALCLLASHGDNRRIETLLERASAAGHARASYQLGLLYLHQGMDDLSLHAFVKADRQGSLLARDQIKALATRSARSRQALLTKIRYAIARGHAGTLERSLGDVNTLYARKMLRRPLLTALRSGQAKAAIWLIDHRMYDRSVSGQRRALGLAIAWRQDDVAATLLARASPSMLKIIVAHDGTLLFSALRAHGSALVGRLIRAGANPLSRSSDGRTAMQYAYDMHQKIVAAQFANAGYSLDKLAIRYLTSLTTDPTSFFSGEPLLAVAAMSGKPELVSHLVATGDNPWQTHGFGMQVINLLYLRGQVTLVRALIAGAPPKVSTTGLIRLAVGNNDAQTLELLLRRTPYSRAAFDNIDATPLWQATRANASVWSQLVTWQGQDTRQAPNGQNLLTHAIALGNPKLASDLVGSGFPVDGKDPFGRTAAWYAATFGDSHLLGQLVATTDLVNVADSTGQTPLLRAVKVGDLAAVQTALASGARVNATSIDGNTALLLAAARHPEIVALLLQHHADYRVRNRNSLTALMVSAQSGCHVCSDLLIAAGANPSRKDARGLSAKDMQSRR